jgi:LacI family transcriptional regulator
LTSAATRRTARLDVAHVDLSELGLDEMQGAPLGAEGTDVQRFVGYRRALEARDIPFDPELTAIGDWTRSGGSRAMRILLTLPNPPTAVFSANDLTAALVNPPLTTVVNPAYEAGRAAGRLLGDRLTEGYTGDRREVVLPSRLVERGST